MKTYHNKPKNSDNANVVQQAGYTPKSRPVTTQAKLQQQAIMNSPQVKQLRDYQQMADDRPRDSHPMASEITQRKENADEEPVQGKFATAQRIADEKSPQGKPAPIQKAEEKPNKTGLPDQLKTEIESLSGMNMDHVKVHYNSAKPTQLQAHAFAQGSDIHVASGQEKHLPHEAWHVVQQAQGRVKPTMQMKGAPVNNDPALETEADVMGEKAKNISAGQSINTTQLQPASYEAAMQFVLADPAGFDEEYITRQSPADQTRLAKRYLGSAEMMERLMDLYFVAYEERMAPATAVESRAWFPRFKRYETAYDNFKGLIKANPIDFAVTLASFREVQLAYESLEDRRDDIRAPAVNPTVALVWANIQAQFTAWDGTLRNRGAWWGSAAPGDVRGAIDIPPAALPGITALARAGGYNVAPSFSGGIGFHRRQGGIDFIYHAQRPA
ncbi:DUF4157 domain-containing protein [Mucilaginibacter sp. HMF5004]|uniref:eCIS core domain-containing protein n=1 Tax=Mucilaginibacter rivuli TaxID=2857527 RepID=UPI001C5F9A12|nr:DUF4157 domain-containing protein [Mucilaginibacter rivuli]MBW4890323.1 DUF4157 domain-containing protein [Mucilaginibacter rivuli]